MTEDEFYDMYFARWEKNVLWMKMKPLFILIQEHPFDPIEILPARDGAVDAEAADRVIHEITADPISRALWRSIDIAAQHIIRQIDSDIPTDLLYFDWQPSFYGE